MYSCLYVDDMQDMQDMQGCTPAASHLGGAHGVGKMVYPRRPSSGGGAQVVGEMV